jgi:hypothetical protein
MNWVLAVLILFIGVEIFFIFWSKHQQSQLSDQAMKLMIEGKYDELAALADSKEMKRYFPPFNCLYLKLNAAMMKKDLNQVEQIKEQMDRLKLSDGQAFSYASQLFQFDIQMELEKPAAQDLDRIDKLKGREELKEYAHRAYRIVFMKKTDDLEALEKEVQTLPDTQKAYDELLLSYCYRNKGDAAKAQEYMELYQRHLVASVTGAQKEKAAS